MDIATRDMIMAALQSEIDVTKSEIMEQLQDIGEIQNENEFLSEIAEDYKKYHDHMIKQKADEKKHLEMLVDYLEKSLNEAGLTENIMEHVKHEQNRILDKLNNIKGSLDEMISNDKLNNEQ